MRTDDGCTVPLLDSATFQGHPSTMAEAIARGSVKRSKVRKEYKGNQYGGGKRKCKFGQKNLGLNSIAT